MKKSNGMPPAYQPGYRKTIAEIQKNVPFFNTVPVSFFLQKNICSLSATILTHQPEYLKLNNSP
jgi:hypothetical protein